MKASSKEAISSSGQGKLIGKNGVSSGISTSVKGTAAVSPGGRGKAIVSDSIGGLMSFKEVSLGPHEGEVRFQLGEETCNDKEDPADELVKRSSDGIVSGDAKRAKCAF